MNVLVVSHELPWPLADGRTLRTYELARHLPPSFTCHLACLPRGAEARAELAARGVFASIHILPPLPARRSWRRWLRRGNRNYFQRSYPGYVRRARASLQTIVDREGIEVAVAGGLWCEEMVRGLVGVRRILDQCDCLTLTLERDLAVRAPGRGPLAGPIARWRLAEVRHAESGLAQRCEMVTAVSPVDVARLRALNPQGVPIELLPNGIDASLGLRPPTAGPPLHGVAFWGNLRFAVNSQAVLDFYERVWRPHLQPHGVRWAIVGPNAGPEIRALADRHPEIDVPGFVDDLFGYLARYPVMVNPMVSGSGLKNKVLEAFAIGMAVVSTPMGVEAVPVEDRVHCRIAADPAAFAAAVRELLADPGQRVRLAAAARALVDRAYTWEAAGAVWASLLAKSGGVQRG